MLAFRPGNKYDLTAPQPPTLTMDTTPTGIDVVTRAQVFDRSAIPLASIRVLRHASCAVHRHEFSELVIVLRGTGIHQAPVGEYPIAAGDVFVLHGDEAHGYQDTEDLDLVNLLFSMDELGLPHADIASLPGFHMLFNLEPRQRHRDRFESRLRLTPSNLRHITGLVDRLDAELTRREPGWAFTALAYFMLIVGDLSRFYSRVEDPAVQPLLRLGRVLSHLEDNYAKRVTLDDLAEVGHMSRRTLSRAFRNATGCSPLDYLVRVRIHHAMELLKEADLSIAEVARRVGFADSNYFSRQFRALVGSSPRGYRSARLGTAD
ncbi:MAG: helix-turn-helix domain-containing protein [Armatimonadetes bacterium]|nr:helix-turn-helix domain-containing protein [Armatimonadota bacterium]